MAQANEFYKELPNILKWSGILIALIVAGFLLVSWIRRRIERADGAASGGFTIADLRRLHRNKELTDEEFERAKAKIVGVMLRQHDPKGPQKSG